MTKYVDIPEQLQRTLYVVYGTGKYNKGQINIQEYKPNSNVTGFEGMLLKEFEVEIDLPKLSTDMVVKEQVNSLKKEKENLMAEHHMKIQKIDDEINQLLAITYQPTADENMTFEVGDPDASYEEFTSGYIQVDEDPIILPNES